MSQQFKHLLQDHDLKKCQISDWQCFVQATEMYEAALQRSPSDQGSREGLTAVKTVFANLEAGMLYLHISLQLSLSSNYK